MVFSIFSSVLAMQSSASAMTEEKMLSYIPKHLEKFPAYSWDTPQRWTVCNGDRFTNEQIDLLCNSGIKFINLGANEVDKFDKPELEHNSIEKLLPAIATGRPMQVKMDPHRKPKNRSTLLTQEEKDAKAKRAMPELWSKLDEGERIELADMYAYFDYKLAWFLMCAGEHSYMMYALNTTPLKRGGTEFFRNVPPFPEWKVPLGKPLGTAVRTGDVWTRSFQHLDVVLNVGNGTAQFNPKKR